MLVEYGKDFIAEFLIKARGLKTEGRETYLLTASPARFLLSPHRHEVANKLTWLPSVEAAAGLDAIFYPYWPSPPRRRPDAPPAVVFVPNGEPLSKFGGPFSGASVRGLIISVNGNSIQIAQGLSLITVDASNAAARGAINGVLVPGRTITAYGSWNGSTFVATSIQ